MVRLIAAVPVLLLAGLPALAFEAQNDMVVEATGEGTFTVPYRGVTVEEDFWCAAGDYVMRGLDKSGATLVYRTSAPPAKVGDAVTFSLSAAGAVSSTGLSSEGGTPGALEAGVAQGLCAESASRRKK
jgi:hypothetical protein